MLMRFSNSKPIVAQCLVVTQVVQYGDLLTEQKMKLNLEQQLNVNKALLILLMQMQMHKK